MDATFALRLASPLLLDPGSENLIPFLVPLNKSSILRGKFDSYFGGPYLAFLKYRVVHYVFTGLYLLLLCFCFVVLIISDKISNVNNYFRNFISKVLITNELFIRKRKIRQ